MTVTSEATAAWKGNLFDGSGTVTLVSSGLATFDVNWKARSEGATATTTPKSSSPPRTRRASTWRSRSPSTRTAPRRSRSRRRHPSPSSPGTGITGSHLNVNAVVPGISPEDFERIAQSAKAGCPVSQALAGVEITIEATLA